MICIQLKGGLGNQLFQFAAASAVANYHKTTVIIDLSFLQKRENDSGYTFRNYELNGFEHIRIRPQTIIEKMFRKATPTKYYHEKTLMFNPLIFEQTSKSSYLTGYFQSEKYFESIKPLLKNTLVIKLPDADYTFEKIVKTNSVSLHIRRGDYISNPENLKFHGLCPMSYYHQAIKYIAERISNFHVFVFSDDLSWAKQHLALSYPVNFIGNKSSIADMQLMSLCKHNITANSSYSWWGAWLNNNPDKIVIAPKKWFADALVESQSDTIVPEEWIRF